MTEKSNKISEADALQIAGGIVASYVSKNPLGMDELPGMLRDMFAAVSALSEGENFLARGEPAVAIAKSITPEYIVCLEDGKKLKMLKRYLRTHYDLSPEQYRRKWGLPADYPMTAPNYAKTRSSLAKSIGLGTAATKSGRKKKARSTKRAASRKRSAA